MGHHGNDRYMSTPTLSASRRAVLAAVAENQSEFQLWQRSGLAQTRPIVEHLAQVRHLRPSAAHYMRPSTVSHALTWLRSCGLIQHDYRYQQPWRMTQQGIDLLAELASQPQLESPGRGRPKGTILFTPADRMALWLIGTQGAVHLEQAGAACCITYGGMRKALIKAGNIVGLGAHAGEVGWIIGAHQRRAPGWFIGKLTPLGVSVFREQFPGYEPAHVHRGPIGDPSKREQSC